MMMEQGDLEYEVQELNPPTKLLTFHQLQEQFWRWNTQIINFFLLHTGKGRLFYCILLTNFEIIILVRHNKV